MVDASQSAPPCGVVLIDKPEGMTSHDVVSQLRRVFKTRRVGHAGTLDPMATGVLVVMVGVATKLAPYLTGVDKTYRAVIQLGASTISLDADSPIVETMPLARWWQEVEVRKRRLRDAVAGEKARTSQIPPQVSAIRVDGKRAHQRVRDGETVAVKPRPVSVLALAVTEVDVKAESITVELSVTKGYYVRALARDLAERLGTIAHLTKLTRTRSGVFDLGDCANLAAETRLRDRVLPLAVAATRALPTAILAPTGVAKVRVGQTLDGEDFIGGMIAPGSYAFCSRAGELLAVGLVDETGARVGRGFAAV